MHVDPAVLPVVDLIVPNDRITISPDLYAGQSVAVDVVVFDKTAALAENVDAALVPVVYFIPSNGGVAVGGYPNAGEIVRMDFVVDELAETVLVHVDPAGLPVVDLAMDDGGISARLHLETGYSVVVDIVCFEIPLKLKKKHVKIQYNEIMDIDSHQSVIKRKNPDIPAVMDVVPSHDRIRVVLHPNSGQRVPTDFVIFIRPLRVIGHIQSDILTIRYITMSDYRVCTHTTHTYSSANCNITNHHHFVCNEKGGIVEPPRADLLIA